MGMRRSDLIGQRFERILVLGRAPNDKYNRTCWKVRCDCDTTKVVSQNNLKNGSTRSCGSLQCWPKGALKHGHKGEKASPTYNSWRAMCQRVLDPNATGYERYGGRGIRVCDRWNPNKGGSFENFLEDLGVRPEGTTLGRKNDVGNYVSGNVSWQTLAEQVANRRPDRTRPYGLKKKITEQIAA
jgi:hypothetical protein